jgi:hypothetical protein
MARPTSPADQFNATGGFLWEAIDPDVESVIAPSGSGGEPTGARQARDRELPLNATVQFANISANIWRSNDVTKCPGTFARHCRKARIYRTLHMTRTDTA